MAKDLVAQVLFAFKGTLAAFLFYLRVILPCQIISCSNRVLEIGQPQVFSTVLKNLEADRLKNSSSFDSVRDFLRKSIFILTVRKNFAIIKDVRGRYRHTSPLPN